MCENNKIICSECLEESSYLINHLCQQCWLQSQGNITFNSSNIDNEVEYYE
jgi:NMD protein affecting ribosome stability and mRNA decay